MTKVQKVLLDLLHQSTGHLTADQLYWQAKHFVPSVSVGTVYRNLNQFVLSGQIRRVSRPNAPDLFETNLTTHDHAVCRSCGRILDVTIPDLESFIAAHSGLNVLSINVTIDDLCPACARKQQDGPAPSP
ncbi:MAG: Fur family transcriptional regulator [Candidatus Limiplasma sp.]|nr:Fur family transcriptional regulator [Candidatus Limiplasma sp.]